MCEQLLGHKVVGLNGLFDLITMDANRDTHKHVLWSFPDFLVIFEKVGSFQGLETEVLVVEISIVDDSRVKLIGVSHNTLIGLFRDHWGMLAILRVDILIQVCDDGRELLLRLLV